MEGGRNIEDPFKRDGNRTPIEAWRNSTAELRYPLPRTGPELVISGNSVWKSVKKVSGGTFRTSGKSVRNSVKKVSARKKGVRKSVREGVGKSVKKVSGKVSEKVSGKGSKTDTI